MGDPLWLRLQNTWRRWRGQPPRDLELEKLDHELDWLEGWLASNRDYLALSVASQVRLETELQVRQGDLVQIERELAALRQREGADADVGEELSQRWGRISWIVEEAIRLLGEHRTMQEKLVVTVLRGEVREAELRGLRALRQARRDLEAGGGLGPERWRQLEALRARLERMAASWADGSRKLPEGADGELQRDKLAAAQAAFDEELEALRQLAAAA